MDNESPREGPRERGRDAQIGPQLSAPQATHGEQLVVDASLRKDLGFQAALGTDEERSDIGAPALQLFGEGESRIEVSTRSTTREQDDRAVMHGPSSRWAEAAHWLRRCLSECLARPW